uniref:Binding-protein-dependent transport system inner membrane component n=1 Tax=Candidatus Kentrum sp. DK TaxID=2126562 RepID=A0A450S8A3_9GAMM|nr:MAG: hypothetical protein BECKDK2373B_GA0170837_101968 [Candidatus Kentron sp. DK]
MAISRLVNALTVALVLLAVDRLSAHGGPLGEGLLAVGQSLWIWMFDDLATDMFYTLTRVFLGFTIAAVLGVFAGLLTGKFAFAASGTVQTLNYLRAITPVALAPFFLVAFGISEVSKVLLVSWGQGCSMLTGCSKLKATVQQEERFICCLIAYRR